MQGRVKTLTEPNPVRLEFTHLYLETAELKQPKATSRQASENMVTSLSLGRAITAVLLAAQSWRPVLWQRCWNHPRRKASADLKIASWIASVASSGISQYMSLEQRQRKSCPRKSEGFRLEVGTRAAFVLEFLIDLRFGGAARTKLEPSQEQALELNWVKAASEIRREKNLLYFLSSWQTDL